MAYNPKRKTAEHLKRVARDLFVFNGRSQRTELALYFLGLLIISALTYVLARPLKDYVEIAMVLLMVPLFVRRLHDINCGGWLAAILPTVIGLQTWGQFEYNAGLQPSPELPWPYNALHVGLVIAFWVIALWPGTKGPNRFGPDPRVVESLAES